MKEEQVQVVADRLAAVCRARWEAQYIELQDYGESMLVAVEVASDVDQRAIEEIRLDIRSVLRQLVPSRKFDYAWTAIIKRDGVVVDSLMGGCTTGLPEI